MSLASDMAYAQSLPGVTAPLLDILSRYQDVCEEDTSEASLWQALDLLLRDSANTQAGVYNPDAVLARIHPKRLWAVPHRVILQQLALRSEPLRRAILTLSWLERTYPNSSRTVNTTVQGWQFSTGHDGVDIEQDLDARDKAHEEALLEAMLKCVRSGDIRSAAELATKRGMHWRAAVMDSAMPGGGDISVWYNNTETIPLFGEFRDGVGTGGPTDRARARVLSTLYRSQHPADECGERHKMLHNALTGSLCGDLSSVMPCMATWRDKLWAVLRCHVITILARHALDVAGGEGYHEEYVAHLGQYGGGSWLPKAEELMLTAATECMPKTFGSHMDDLVARIVLALLTNESGAYLKALETAATKVCVDEPVLMMHFADILNRAFNEGFVTADPQQTAHYAALLQAYADHMLPRARGSANAATIHQAPLYFYVTIRDQKKRTQLLADYCKAVRQSAKAFLDPQTLETSQEQLLDLISQLVSMSSTSMRPDEAAAVVREQMAASSSGAAPEEAVMWLSMSVAPIHSERALRQALKELRSALPKWTASTLQSARAIVEVAARKVLPQFDIVLSTEPKCSKLPLLKFEFKFWENVADASTMANAVEQTMAVALPGAALTAVTTSVATSDARNRLLGLVPVITAHLHEICVSDCEEPLKALVPNIVARMCQWTSACVRHALSDVSTEADVGVALSTYTRWVDELVRLGIDEVLPKEVLREVVMTAKALTLKTLETQQRLHGATAKE